MNPRPPLALSALLSLALGAGLLAAASPAQSHAEEAATRTAATDSVPDDLLRVDGRVFGRSGALRVALVRAMDALELPFVLRQETPEGVSYRWVPLFGTQGTGLAGESLLRDGLFAPPTAGVWRLQVRAGEESQEVRELAVITQLPFDIKSGSHLNGYHIGRYPSEAGDGDHGVPMGFIEVTPENQDLHVSEHFQLRQFITKDQHNVWPKYVALDLRLIDKLELVLQELRSMGVRAERMTVMSGFRTPQYNGPGGNGRAKHSRHTFGDAADVWVQNDGHWYISDLNGDGRRDTDDVKLMLRAVDRVEQRYPELIGGAGLYNSLGDRGPFIHIDVRGQRTRW
ncbi:hypothetical protein BH23GEM7_BH23GEM7_41660 [soil metagenome]